MNEIKLLDKGYVRLVDHMGGDLSVVRAARVSHDAAWRAGDDSGSDARLIAYLLKHRHTSPFEHVTFTFEVKAPIFIFRQWHRHRTFSFNEISGRYTQLEPEFYIPSADTIGVQAANNKQARDLSGGEGRDRRADLLMYREVLAQSFATYKELLNRGWPRELARSVLPVSTYSSMFATVDLHNLLHFIELRDHEGAQYEIQLYARAVAELIKPVVPVTWGAWNALKNGTS